MSLPTNSKKIMNKIKKTKHKITAKKHKSIAPRISNRKNTKKLFGIMKGTIHIIGDIISPVD